MTPGDRKKIFKGTVEEFDNVLVQLQGEMMQSFEGNYQEPMPVKIIRELLEENDNLNWNDRLAAYRVAMIISVYKVDMALLSPSMKSRIKIYYRKHCFTRDTFKMLGTEHVSSTLFAMDVSALAPAARTKRRNRMIDQLLPLKKEVYAMISLLSYWQPGTSAAALPAELAAKIVALSLPKTRITTALCGVDDDISGLSTLIGEMFLVKNNNKKMYSIQKSNDKALAKASRLKKRKMALLDKAPASAAEPEPIVTVVQSVPIYGLFYQAQPVRKPASINPITFPYAPKKHRFYDLNRLVRGDGGGDRATSPGLWVDSLKRRRVDVDEEGRHNLVGSPESSASDSNAENLLSDTANSF